MKTSIKYRLFLLFLLPFSAFGQVDQSNPVQQQVNLYGGTNLDNDPQAINNMDKNNEFVIHEVIQSNKVNTNFIEQQESSSSKSPSHSISSSGGSSSNGSIRLGVNFKRSKIKVDHKFHRLFHRSSKKKRSNTSCFSWS